MILKVIERDGSVWTYDNLERIKNSERRTLGPDEKLDSCRLVAGLDIKAGTETYYQFGCLSRDNHEYTIASFHEAFIMSDEGRTLSVHRC